MSDSAQIPSSQKNNELDLYNLRFWQPTTKVLGLKHFILESKVSLLPLAKNFLKNMLYRLKYGIEGNIIK